MINDQAILHLIGRLEHENVALREELRQAAEKIRALEAERADRPDTD